MCGLAGFFAHAAHAAPMERATLIAMRDRMAPRGPDGVGLWVAPDGRAGFGHRRLSIIDLTESGAQPMATPDGRYTIAYNGEIYNYRKLRADLVERGVTFVGDSDTEVILHLFARHGADMLLELRGMFALAIWDAHARTMFLARDPLGIKPLYYADCGGTLRFASQVKALLADPAISRAPSPAGLTGFHLTGSVPEPFTAYRAIHALPAGHWLSYAEDKPATPVRYAPVCYANVAATLAEAKGQTSRFLSVYEEYKKAPDVTRQRIYLETMEKVLGGADKIISDSGSSQGVVPYLPLPGLSPAASPPSPSPSSQSSGTTLQSQTQQNGASR